jgi:hypothetical protein
MAFTRNWDETFPPDTQVANLLGQDIRDFKTDIRERIAAISGTAANRPAVGDMITGWGTYGGGGVLYFATDTGAVSRWNGASWDDVSASFGSKKPTVGGTIISPTGAMDFMAWRAPYACTATGIFGYCPDADVTINAGRFSVGNLHSSNIALTAGVGSAVAVDQNSAFVIGSEATLLIISIDSGTPSYVFIQVDFTRP